MIHEDTVLNSPGASEVHENQRRVWNAEWDAFPSAMQTVPGHNSHVPSEAIVDFVEFVRKNSLYKEGDSLLDMGCGVGRNIPFLSRYFNVTGSDYSEVGLHKAQYELETIGVEASLVHHDLTSSWPFTPGSFAVAIDSLTSASIYTEAARQTFVSELFKAIQPGGLVLVRVVSSEDELERELMDANPGPEPGSSIWPGSNKFQKNFSEEEIRGLYTDYTILDFKQEVKPAALKLGRITASVNFWMIAQKPD